MGRKEEAPIPVEEFGQQKIGECLCKFDIARTPLGLQQDEQSVEEIRVVVEKSVVANYAVIPYCREPIPVKAVITNKVDGTLRRMEPRLLVKTHRGFRHALDCESVP